MIFLKYIMVLILATHISSEYVRVTSIDLMKCSYGERGSLTATCYNASPIYFKNTPYRFDHLDETLKCSNCSLKLIDSGTFDISGNQIKNLDLSNSSINSIRQRAFVGLIFLERLILAQNDIQSIYPGTFIGVKKINYVNLENNSISVLSADGFLELINLKELNLRNNQIKTILPQAFHGLINLNILDLSNNEIGNVKEIFNNLTSLQILNLNNNKIGNLMGDEFNNLTSLLEITLSENYIKTIPALEFVTMSSLRQLDLSYNIIDKIIPGSFQGLPSLENLDINNNYIADVPQKALQNLHNLRNLNISNNIVSTFQTGLYSGLPQLKVLDLSHNYIADLKISGVFSLHSLHTLDLSYNNITDVDYVALISRLPRISYLNLKDNLLPCSLEKELEEYFAEDNFKFILHENKVGSVKCIENPRIEKTKTHHKIEIEKEENLTRSSSHMWIFSLIFLTLILIGVLFYLQFRTFTVLKTCSIQRSTSQLQLISSAALEARDNDYLKE